MPADRRDDPPSDLPALDEAAGLPLRPRLVCGELKEQLKTRCVTTPCPIVRPRNAASDARPGGCGGEPIFVPCFRLPRRKATLIITLVYPRRPHSEILILTAQDMRANPNVVEAARACRPVSTATLSPLRFSPGGVCAGTPKRMTRRLYRWSSTTFGILQRRRVCDGRRSPATAYQPGSARGALRVGFCTNRGSRMG